MCVLQIFERWFLRYGLTLIGNGLIAFILRGTGNCIIASVLVGEGEITTTPKRWPENLTSVLPKAHLIGLIIIPYFWNLSKIIFR